MTGNVLREARRSAQMTQAAAACKLGVSQPLLAAMENNTRSITSAVAVRVVSALGVSPVHLPFTSSVSSEEVLAGNLAALGYPGFSHLSGELRNPAEVLFDALNREQLDARLVEALPWLPLEYSEMDWKWLYDQARRHNRQNRLGFVLMLSAKVALTRSQRQVSSKLYQALKPFYEARLAKCDTLCQASWPATMRTYAHSKRSKLAAYWNLDTRLQESDLALFEDRRNKQA